MHILSVAGQCVHSEDHGVEKEAETIADRQLDLSRFTRQNEAFKSSISGCTTAKKTNLNAAFWVFGCQVGFGVNTVVYYTTPVYIHQQMQRAPF